MKALNALNVTMSLNEVNTPSEGRYESGCIDFVDCGVLNGPIVYGEVSADGGQAGYTYLNRAIDDALSGEVVGLATAPLNKESLQSAELPYIDHTAVLKARAARREPMTLFLVRTLKIFFLTRHISFREIPDAITKEGILEALPLCELYLRQLGVEEPTLAVAGLNPHGGEKGLFGREEMEVIGPAVVEAQTRGYRVAGSVPADSVFHQALEGRYDGVLSLYHDQGHIPLKLTSMDDGVNVTLGIPIVRTSVDHGTAYDIAGRNLAREHSLCAAFKMAARLTAPRGEMTV